MNIKNQLQHSFKKIKFLFKELSETILFVFPNLITGIAVATMLFSFLCFANSVNFAQIDYDNLNTEQNTNSPLLKEDNDSNTEIENTLNTNPTETEQEIVYYNTADMCFVGDNRVIDMSDAVYTDARFIAEPSADLNWLNEVAIIELEKNINEIKVCVVALGINDLYNLNNYIITLNDLANRHTDVVFVCSTVGPIDETMCVEISNSSIEEFNKMIVEGLNNRWQVIDQYTYLASNGFNSSDGIRYGNAVSAGIFAWMVESLSVQNVEIN